MTISRRKNRVGIATDAIGNVLKKPGHFLKSETYNKYNRPAKTSLKTQLHAKSRRLRPDLYTFLIIPTVFKFVLAFVLTRARNYNKFHSFAVFFFLHSFVCFEFISSRIFGRVLRALTYVLWLACRFVEYSSDTPGNGDVIIVAISTNYSYAD